MRRVLTIAQSEFLTLVKTKAFIIGIFLMPVLMFVFVEFMNYAERHVDTENRPFAVIDGTGTLYAPIAAAAERVQPEVGARRRADRAALRSDARRSSPADR